MRLEVPHDVDEATGTLGRRKEDVQVIGHQTVAEKRRRLAVAQEIDSINDLRGESGILEGGSPL
jgi:hypothetical protein